jgi:hypothetical protein
MSESVNWCIGNGLQLNVVAPLDYSPNPSVPVVMDAATTVTGYIFDKLAKNTCSAAASASAVLVVVDSVSHFTDGDDITVEETDGTLTRHTNIVITASTKTIAFTTGLTVGAAVGARVWKHYGAEVVTGVFYGTAAVDSSAWGYLYDFRYDYDSALRRNLRLEAMAVLHKSSTSGHFTQTWDVVMTEPFGNP